MPGVAQLALPLDDWHGMADAPQNARWVEGWDGTKVVLMHFAQDLSGSDQPAYSGWFTGGPKGEGYFWTVYPPPRRWRYLPPEKDRELNHWMPPYA